VREILPDLERWLRAGKQCALARVVRVEGSGPREAGAAMAVSADFEVVGSVSGGCIESAVVEEARDVLAGRKGPHMVAFGYSDDDAFAVGLTCGGTVHVFIEAFLPIDRSIDVKASFGGEVPVTSGAPMSGFHTALCDAVRTHRPVALATLVEGPGIGSKLLICDDPDSMPDLGSLGNDELTRVVARDARSEPAAGRSEIRHYGPEGQARQDEIAIFIESFSPPPQMIIFGAVDFTGALVQVAKLMGFRVRVCDAREIFATAERFPDADEVLNVWPHELLEDIGDELGPRDAVCILTHDPKFDVPAITSALKTRVGYIGCMGSRRTHTKRLERLHELDVGEVELRRVLAPIGLDIGARTPDEIAISICSEIIALRYGRKGFSLRDTAGPIHGA